MEGFGGGTLGVLLGFNKGFMVLLCVCRFMRFLIGFNGSFYWGNNCFLIVVWFLLTFGDLVFRVYVGFRGLGLPV